MDFLKQNNKRGVSSFTCKFLLLQFLQDLFPPALTNCPWVSQDAGLSVFLLKTLLHKQKRERLCKAKYKFQDIMWSFEMGFFINRIIFFCNCKFSKNFDLPHWLIRHTDTSLSCRHFLCCLCMSMCQVLWHWNGFNSWIWLPINGSTQISLCYFSWRWLYADYMYKVM